MASLIPGYEYDIFISYRQKDNKGDKWVSEFVEALKVELESAFKEDISVYFDENPHDRLQETYNVKKSLEAKLKCLIFIPILSRTYCDPNSYAWQYEFLPFIGMASDDRFGLDVRLRNGNVACRILPVRIHDLDTEDIKLFEKETKSVIRTLDFVFKTSSGVNRPLRSAEDHPNDNLNKTFYRDQINKVANAVKEIILGLQTEPHGSGEEKKPPEEKSRIADTAKEIPEHDKPFILTSKKIYSGVFFISLVLAFILFYPKFFRKDKFENIRDAEGRISIAVMPFENLTGDTTLNWFSRGVSSLLINGLGASSELAVSDDQTIYEVLESMDQVFTAAISPSLARQAAEKARAETYITGSFQGRDDKYWILVNLIDTRNGDIIWTNKVEGDLKSAQYLNLTDSLCREIKDYLEIKALEQKTDYDFREAFPKSAEAYRYFIEGVNLILTSEYEAATLSLERALEIDSTFTLASFYMAFAYNVGRLSQAAEQTLKWVQKAYETKEEIPLKYQYWLELWYACMISQDPDDMLKYCNLLEKTGMESRILWFDLGITYIDFFRQYDKATDAFVRVEEINRERGNEWKYDRYYNEYCEALLLAGRPGEVKRIADLGLKVNPDNAWLIVYKGSSYALLGDTVSLRNTLSEIESYREKHNIPVVAVESGLGWMYYLAKDTARMEEHYRNAFILDPGNRNRAADLAWSLIRFNINPEEGLKMTEEVLENYPDLAWWIWMKGLALHRLGYHAEGLELLKQADEKYNTYNIELKNDIKEAEKAVESQI